MNKKSNFMTRFFCVLCYCLVLESCIGASYWAPSLTPTVFQTPSQAATMLPLVTPAVETASTLTPQTSIITPDSLFVFPGLKLSNTPDAIDFCEHLPSPQLSMDTNESSLLLGRFSLCVSHSWPWVKTAMDLDTGTLVALEDKDGDIAMDYTHPDLNGEALYFVHDLNNAHIDDLDSANLTYDNCEKLVADLNGPGSVRVQEGRISCVMTTEGRLAVIRVERIYPSNTQSVEFSFAILKR